MTKPTKPTLGEHTTPLPEVDKPSTWEARTIPFFKWAATGLIENMRKALNYVESAMNFIEGALNGADTIVSAVNNLQNNKLGKTEKAANSDKLDGKHASAFLEVNGTAVKAQDSDNLGGQAPSYYQHVDGAFGFKSVITSSESDGLLKSGFYRVNQDGYTSCLLHFSGMSGSAPSLQISATHNDQLYFRVARDTETNFDGVTSFSNKIWHSGNDGSGSGLDADKLHGLQGDKYAKVTFGEVGSYIFANCNIYGNIAPNTVVSGINLRPSSSGGHSLVSSPLLGSWRLMGYKGGNDTSFAGSYETGLWVRVA